MITRGRKYRIALGMLAGWIMAVLVPGVVAGLVVYQVNVARIVPAVPTLVSGVRAEPTVEIEPPPTPPPTATETSLPAPEPTIGATRTIAPTIAPMSTWTPVPTVDATPMPTTAPMATETLTPIPLPAVTEVSTATSRHSTRPWLRRHRCLVQRR